MVVERDGDMGVEMDILRVGSFFRSGFLWMEG